MKEVPPPDAPAEHEELAQFGRVSLEVGGVHFRPQGPFVPRWARLRLSGGSTGEMIDQALDYARGFPLLLAVGLDRVLRYDFSDERADVLYLWEHLKR
jgi:hypothetical protein